MTNSEKWLIMAFLTAVGSIAAVVSVPQVNQYLPNKPRSTPSVQPIDQNMHAPPNNATSDPPIDPTMQVPPN